MPFWWRRRKKPWYFTWRKRRYFQNRKRRTYRRRKPRYPARRRRRRRRRHRKVRRKRKTLQVKQWQPDSIRKCKIKGFQTLVAGAEGRQMRCYTNTIYDYIQPKAPAGGGFGCLLISLQYLYHQYQAHKNIWTASNDWKDLCRYSGCKITLYRHPTTDFIFCYERQPPFTIEKETYTNLHPVNLLLRKNKVVLLSQQSKPNGKLTKKIRIGPPKQMTNKWFFQEEFTEHGLVMLQASATNFNWSEYAPTAPSNSLTFYSLSTQFFNNSNWEQHHGENAYLPWSTLNTTLRFYYPTRTQPGYVDMNPSGMTYAASVAKKTGWFRPEVLTATKVTYTSGTTAQHNLPITIARYNPSRDTGEGSKIWLISTLTDGWGPPQDIVLKMQDKPLWMMIWGFYDYIMKMKHAGDFMISHLFVLQSPAIELITPHTQTMFPVLDYEFITGSLAYDEYISPAQEAIWVPNAYKQLKTLNLFCESGPYVPKYAQERVSSWELKFHYCFYFKWGGPYETNPDVSNPKNQGKYPVPNSELQTIQIADPLKQTYKQMLRAWDYRRGIITAGALKRIQKDSESDETNSNDSTPAKKKKRLLTGEPPTHQEKQEDTQSYLLSLCKESTSQEENQSVLQLIHHQQQQQEKLKHNLLKLLVDMKKQQRRLQLQTGMLD
nr:MAG: ORF1 [Torque teno midi virus]UHK06136.1 MAG: ORF1 [Torque teno midi virus]UHK06143.1 MAG: ORF1 [Torque teno midi virus]UHK06182.1 MAG: ORF1 [Torque teno midi virus]UHK06196.1 MAG: ORF1 [Torque teno midi virus]